MRARFLLCTTEWHLSHSIQSCSSTVRSPLNALQRMTTIGSSTSVLSIYFMTFLGLRCAVSFEKPMRRTFYAFLKRRSQSGRMQTSVITPMNAIAGGKPLFISAKRRDVATNTSNQALQPTPLPRRVTFLYVLSSCFETSLSASWLSLNSLGLECARAPSSYRCPAATDECRCYAKGS